MDSNHVCQVPAHQIQQIKVQIAEYHELDRGLAQQVEIYKREMQRRQQELHQQQQLAALQQQQEARIRAHVQRIISAMSATTVEQEVVGECNEKEEDNTSTHDRTALVDLIEEILTSGSAASPAQAGTQEIPVDSPLTRGVVEMGVDGTKRNATQNLGVTREIARIIAQFVGGGLCKTCNKAQVFRRGLHDCTFCGHHCYLVCYTRAPGDCGVCDEMACGEQACFLCRCCNTDYHHDCTAMVDVKEELEARMDGEALEEGEWLMCEGCYAFWLAGLEEDSDSE